MHMIWIDDNADGEVDGKVQPLHIASYAGAVRQMLNAVSYDLDEAGAAAWYMVYREQYQKNGLSYNRFMAEYRRLAGR